MNMWDFWRWGWAPKRQPRASRNLNKRATLERRRKHFRPKIQHAQLIKIITNNDINKYFQKKIVEK